VTWVKDEAAAGDPGNFSWAIFTDDSPNAPSKTLVFDTDVGPQAKALVIAVVRLEFVATATVGNRALVFELLDAEDDTVLVFASATAITAGQARDLQFAPMGRPEVVLSPLIYVDVPVREVVLLKGMKLRCRDVNAIDVFDDMTVHVHGRVY